MARMIRRAKQYGFTLVELLIVVAIIGVLSTVGIPSFRRMVQKSKKSEAKVNLGGLYTAEQAFFSEYGGFGNHLARLGFNIDGNPDNLMYVVGFTGANCNSTVANAAAVLPATGIPADAIGLAVTQSFPQYYIGAGPGAAFNLRPVLDNVTGNWLPGASSMGNRRMGAPGCGAPINLVPLYQVGAVNNVYGFANGAAAPNLHNRFVALAHGVIAPGVNKTTPSAATLTDVWAVNQDRQMANMQDGVK